MSTVKLMKWWREPVLYHKSCGIWKVIVY